MHHQNSQGLALFWQNALKDHATHEEYERITQLLKDTSAFRKDIAKLLAEGGQIAQENQAIQALYYEYYYDGSEESAGNLFLCHRFHQKEGNWASDFEDFIEGMVIAPYFGFDPDFEMSPTIAYIAQQYIHAVLLDSAIDAVKANPVPVPFGFASHDDRAMVVILPHTLEIIVIVWVRQTI